MPIPYDRIVELILSGAISDKEAFIDKLTETIEKERSQSDLRMLELEQEIFSRLKPASGEKSETIPHSQNNDEILLQISKNLQELTEAIKELSANINQNANRTCKH